MVTTIKKGTSRVQIHKLLKQRFSKPSGVNLKKYCGIISLKKDPMILQKEWRNEWE